MHMHMPQGATVSGRKMPPRPKSAIEVAMEVDAIVASERERRRRYAYHSITDWTRVQHERQPTIPPPVSLVVPPTVPPSPPLERPSTSPPRLGMSQRAPGLRRPASQPALVSAVGKAPPPSTSFAQLMTRSGERIEERREQSQQARRRSDEAHAAGARQRSTRIEPTKQELLRQTHRESLSLASRRAEQEAFLQDGQMRIQAAWDSEAATLRARQASAGAVRSTAVRPVLPIPLRSLPLPPGPTGGAVPALPPPHHAWAPPAPLPPHPADHLAARSAAGAEAAAVFPAQIASADAAAAEMSALLMASELEARGLSSGGSGAPQSQMGLDFIHSVNAGARSLSAEAIMAGYPPSAALLPRMIAPRYNAGVRAMLAGADPYTDVEYATNGPLRAVRSANAIRAAHANFPAGGPMQYVRSALHGSQRRIASKQARPRARAAGGSAPHLQAAGAAGDAHAGPSPSIESSADDRDHDKRGGVATAAMMTVGGDETVPPTDEGVDAGQAPLDEADRSRTDRLLEVTLTD